MSALSSRRTLIKNPPGPTNSARRTAAGRPATVAGECAAARLAQPHVAVFSYQVLGLGASQQQFRPFVALIDERHLLADEIVIEMLENCCACPATVSSTSVSARGKDEHVSQRLALHSRQERLATRADVQTPHFVRAQVVQKRAIGTVNFDLRPLPKVDQSGVRNRAASYWRFQVAGSAAGAFTSFGECGRWGALCAEMPLASLYGHLRVGQYDRRAIARSRPRVERA